ncbi:gluconeogenesis factor YvcK family protein [Orenia marismortui]|uniref:Putative gluconeogenesis factor n=1 Tax=Orenia marismortui TaxID=46469 RepID=A0A4R8GT60_9FIRM|nr:YvcK family protein [Orenia marismortui]TDX45283.1 putative cofD-like protein [Orenia marismortui]
MNKLRLMLYPGLKFKRWVFVIISGVILISLGVSMALNLNELNLLRYEVIGFLLVLAGIYVVGLGIRRMIISIYDALLPDKNAELIELLYQERYRRKGPKIVVVGGGTGLSTMLRGIKKFTNNITAIVTVADDGGSSGALRDELGILPPGDIRNCLVALADTEPLMEKLFQYRFSDGEDLKGHSFGNLFIATMTEVLGDFDKAVKESSKVLAIKGQVLPSTLEDVRLSARLKSGELIKGESQIPKVEGKIEEVFINPENSKPLPEALTALKEADAIILGPGSLYTSLLPNLLVKELSKAIKSSEALKLYICNVMTQFGETDDYTVSDHVQTLYDHVGDDIIDYVLVNNEEVDSDLLFKYAKEGAKPVEIDWDKLEELDIEVIEESLINQSDLVRHNPDKLAKVIIDLILERR